jgi:hypothetical protein
VLGCLGVEEIEVIEVVEDPQVDQIRKEFAQLFDTLKIWLLSLTDLLRNSPRNIKSSGKIHQQKITIPCNQSYNLQCHDKSTPAPQYS